MRFGCGHFAFTTIIMQQKSKTAENYNHFSIVVLKKMERGRPMEIQTILWNKKGLDENGILYIYNILFFLLKLISQMCI